MSIDKRTRTGEWGLGQTQPHTPKKNILMEVISMSQNTSNSSETPHLESLWNVSQLASCLNRNPSTIYPRVALYLLHHERIDGQGYPLGLKDQEIPIGAKIIAIADAFGFLTSKRPYRSPLSFKKTQQELVKGSNTQFDSFLLNLFLLFIEDISPKNIFISKTTDLPYLTIKHHSNLTQDVELCRNDYFYILIQNNTL